MMAEEETSRVDLSELWKEAKDFKAHFNTKDLLQAIILGLLFSASDTGSDFNFARAVETECSDFHKIVFTFVNEKNETEEGFYLENTNRTTSPCGGLSKDTVQSFIYIFISLPGLLLLLAYLHSVFASLAARVCCHCCKGKLFNNLGNVLSLLLLGGIIFVLLGLSANHQTANYAAALLSAGLILGVKLLAVFLHGPQMKRLSVRMTSVESQFESALQLGLVLSIWFSGGETTTSAIFSATSSVIMIGKAGAEKFLTFGAENKLEGLSLGGKLGMLAWTSPVFILTAIFRISGLAIIFAWAGNLSAGNLLLAALLVPPFLGLFLMKCCRLEDISLGDLLKGAVAEVTTLTLWGRRGREGSRKISLILAVYFLLVHTIILSCSLAMPTLFHSEGMPSVVQRAAIICLVSGWTSFPLIICQIFCLLHPFSTLRKIKTLTLAI